MSTAVPGIACSSGMVSGFTVAVLYDADRVLNSNEFKIELNGAAFEIGWTDLGWHKHLIKQINQANSHRQFVRQPLHA